MTSADREQPLVSCIMPTYNRRAFVSRAIELFLRQDYPRKELIVVDDGSDCIRDLLPADARVRYLRLDHRATVGAKRNLACEQASGTIIAHWDDDDWHAPHRLTYQVGELLQARADLCGINVLLFYDARSGRAWRYSYGSNGAASRRWLSGSSLCYRRALWARHRFADANVGEDSRFVWAAKDAKLHVPSDSTFHVGLIHAKNVSPKQTGGSHWRSYPIDDLRRLLGADWTRFADPPARPAAATPSPSDPGRVTVSIPYANCREYIVQAVESILAQQYANLRLIVVNDGDPRPPWDLLAHIDDPRLVRFDLPGNFGRYFADAVVVEATPDPLFLVQDADDWSAPERIETLLTAMRAEQAVGAVSAAFNHHQKGEQRVKVKDYFPHRGEPLTAENVHRLNHHGLFDVAALRRIGGYYAGQRIGHDTLICNLLLMTGCVAYAERPVYHRRLRSGSLCTSPDTGMGTPARRAASTALQSIYDEAFKQYGAYQRGAISLEALGARIRLARDRHVKPDEQATLQREAQRLRELLAEQNRRRSASPELFEPGRVEASALPTTPVDGDDRTTLADPPSSDAALALRRARPPLVDDRRLVWDAWSISRPLAAALAEHLEQRAPRRLLELGSGLSTLVLAEYAASSGATVVSLEHDPRYYARTDALLVSLGLRRHVDLQLATLGSLVIAGRRYPWYSAPLDGTFDFVFVDGPPLKYGRQAVLPGIASSLAPEWELWLKDGHRPHEQACVELWRGQTPIDGALYDIDPKGVWILWPASRSAAAEPSWPAVRRLPTPSSSIPDPAYGARPSAPIAAIHQPAAVADRRVEQPLVSCIMPTYNRRRFLPQAIRLFLRQDYSRSELIILDDGSDPVRDLVPEDERIRYIRLPGQQSIGAKRNLACEHARGEIIVLWDDDDWYDQSRISYQVEPLLTGRVDANGLAESLVMDLATSQFWRCTPRLHQRMFVQGIVSGTLAFRKRFWQQGARFPNVSLAEDAAFQRELVRRGARLEPLTNPHHFVYVRHGKNSWQFKTGQFLDRQGWQAIRPPSFMPPHDLAFYRELRDARES